MLAVLTNISYACFRANNQFNIHKCVAFEAFRWSKCSRQEKEINRTAEQDIHPIFAFKPSIGPLPCGLFFAGQPYKGKHSFLTLTIETMCSVHLQEINSEGEIQDFF